ncbi:MAG: hypothetical protein WAL75_14190 [Terracidiphilus sp.]
MKNITVKVTDDAYHEARVWAAAHKTSISAIVQHCIQNLPRLKSTNRAVMQIVRERQQAALQNSAAEPHPATAPFQTESTTSVAPQFAETTPAH